MPAAANTGPTPVPEADASRNNSASQQESQQNKRDLASWWKQFKRSEKKNQEQQGQSSFLNAQHSIIAVSWRESRAQHSRAGRGTEMDGQMRKSRQQNDDEIACDDLLLTSSAASPVEGIFGVPLSVSIRYANVAISLFNEDGQGYIYGYVPIVVAKCGVYLKEKGM